jgi:hypothetical protein
LDGTFTLRRKVEEAYERFGIPESNSIALRVSLLLMHCSQQCDSMFSAFCKVYADTIS